jgi:hypothetical protein
MTPAFFARVAAGAGLTTAMLLAPTGAGAQTAISDLRRDSVPYYAAPGERQEVGQLTRADFAGFPAPVLAEEARYYQVETKKGTVWLRSLHVKQAHDLPAPCAVTAGGNEGTAVSRGMGQGCQ